MNSLKGVVFVLILAVVIYFGGLVLMPPAILALPFSLSLYRKINDQSIANFLKFVPVRVQSIFDLMLFRIITMLIFLLFMSVFFGNTNFQALIGKVLFFLVLGVQHFICLLMVILFRGYIWGEGEDLWRPDTTEGTMHPRYEPPDAI